MKKPYLKISETKKILTALINTISEKAVFFNSSVSSKEESNAISKEVQNENKAEISFRIEELKKQTKYLKKQNTISNLENSFLKHENKYLKIIISILLITIFKDGEKRNKPPLLNKHKLKASLSNGNTQIVFDELKRFYSLNKSNNVDEIVLLNSKYNILEQKVRNDLIELQVELREKQKINKSLLYFINQVE